MIDIILSAYNGSSYIREQIDSVLGSDCRDIRLFVFDDVSSDDTADIVREYEQAEPGRVFLIKNAFNKGFCRNFLPRIIPLIITRSATRTMSGLPTGRQCAWKQWRPQKKRPGAMYR